MNFKMKNKNKEDNIPNNLIKILNICYSVVDEDCYPYKGKEDKCRIPRRGSWKHTHCPLPDNPQRKEMYKVSPAYRLGNETDIMYEIIENGPVQGNIYITYIADIQLHKYVFVY